MEFQELFSKLNDGKLAPPTDKKKWEEASDRISIHAKGIRPQFNNPRKRGNGSKMPASGIITPANYEERYQYLFDNYILNRHPNEQEEHYQFRLSVYPLLSKEIYLMAKAQIGGSIFQTSQYTIEANDDIGQAMLDRMEFIKRLKEDYFEHILTDPFGKFAVIESHFEEFGTDEKAEPHIEMVESRYILHFDAGESILFRSQKKAAGRALFYFLDRNYCIKLIQPEDRKKSYEVVSAYEHGLGELPVVDNNKYLFESYTTWADLIARNFSDDEIVAKNNNHPHIQMVESVCHECLGGRVKDYPCDTCETGVQEENCHTCSGRGTISVNPGEIHIIKEADLRPGEVVGNAGMADRIKFINPDVAISKNSLERAQWIYEQGLKSLHLKYIEEGQSGVAKALDRDQLYILISTVSDHTFFIGDRLLRYSFGYLNMGISETKPYIIEQPTQFQIKTEADIQEEMIALKDADLSTIREKTDEFNQVVYSGNRIKLKKWEVIKMWDSLYCIKPDDIATYKLLGGVTDADVIKHVKADYILNQIIIEKGENWINSASTKQIIEEMDAKLVPLLPVTRIEIPPNPVA